MSKNVASYAIDSSEVGYIRIDHVSIEDHWGRPVDMSGALWFERSDLGWVVDRLRTCLTTYPCPEATLAAGSDNLKVFEAGPELAPYVHMHNRRPPASAHGGGYSFAMSRPLAQRLLDELAMLLLRDHRRATIGTGLSGRAPKV
jgi:hypothetical protein